MQATFRSGTWDRAARLVVLSAGLGVMAGCVTGYAVVRPDAAGSGAYYTSDGPYSGQGYDDYYGTGPYYPGTSGYGYYSGTDPYSDPFGGTVGTVTGLRSPSTSASRMYGIFPAIGGRGIPPGFRPGAAGSGVAAIAGRSTITTVGMTPWPQRRHARG